MPATVVLGAQWGDEGKGKVVDALAERADVIVRFNGGANAGHTIVIGDKTYPIHLLPSGIFREGKMNIVGPGVAFDPNIAMQELKLAQQFGSHVMFDHSAPIVLPIHRQLDAARELAAGSSAIGTTKRGIGPCYSDFWLRRGLTLGDLSSRDRIREVLERGKYWSELFAINSVLKVDQIDFRDLGMTFNPFHLEDTIDWCLSMGENFQPYIWDTRQHVYMALSEGEQVLFEGAQGIMLDRFYGSSPYCTSSLCSAAGVSATFGVYTFERVIGVAKAYCTRVGAGPFPTELLDENGEELRRRGHEFGTTTGRPRRCGWLDLRALDYACRMGGVTELVITKLDVLADFPRRLYVCSAYKNISTYQTLTNDCLKNEEPVLQRMPIWKDALTTNLDDLSAEVGKYLRLICQVTGKSISGIGIGPARDQILWR